MDENTVLDKAISEHNGAPLADQVVEQVATDNNEVASTSTSASITIGRKPRKNAAVAANPHRPLRHRRSSSYARRQR